MITSSMTYREMFDHFSKDREKLLYRDDYYLPKAIKELSASKTFPAWKKYEYVTPNTRNKYILFYYAADRRAVNDPMKGIFSVVYYDKTPFIFKWLVSGYRHTPERDYEGVRTIYIYSRHFFQRYNERFIKDSSLDMYDVAIRFFARNIDYMPIEITKGINKNIEIYGDDGKRGFKVKDGICFAQSAIEGQANEEGDKNKDIIDAIVFLFTTFVPESQMTDEQQEAVLKEHWEKWIHSYESFMKEAKDGELTLRINH